MNCIVFDLETTGLDTDTVEIVEIAAIAFNYDSCSGPTIVSDFSSLVKPIFNNPGAVAIHGLSDEMLADADGIDVVGPCFLEWVATVPMTNRWWVGHNIRKYDMPILRRCIGGDSDPNKLLDGHLFDTLEMARHVYHPRQSKKLSSLYKYLRPDEDIQAAHSATFDVKMNLILAVDEFQRLND